MRAATWLFVAAALVANAFAWPAVPTLATLAALRDRALSQAGDLSVAMGFNVCIDKVARLVHVLQKAPSYAEATHGSVPDLYTSSRAELEAAAVLRRKQLPPEALIDGTIDSLASLALLAEEFVSKGAAAERVMADEAGFRALLAAAGEPDANAHDRLGGNAALMGRELTQHGVQVTLGGRIGPVTEELLNHTVQLASPVIEDGDDTHLILEYAQGEAFRGEEGSPRANRLIVTMDAGLANIDPLVSLIQRVIQRNSDDALVVSGLHMLEQLPQIQWQAQLDALRTQLLEVPSDIAVHVELASVASHKFLRALCDTVLVASDSIGLNEQELADLHEAMGGLVEEDAAIGTREALAGSKTHMPKIPAVVAAARFILSKIPSLSRVHVHTLGFQAVLQAAPAHRLRFGLAVNWGYPGDTAAASSSTATERACSSPAAGLQESEIEFRVEQSFEASDQTLASLLPQDTTNSHVDFSRASHRTKSLLAGIAKPSHLTLTPEFPVARMTLVRYPDLAVKSMLSQERTERYLALIHQGESPQSAYTLVGGEGTVPSEPFPQIPQGDVIVDAAIAPVAVCKHPKSTVGLGDAVSAAGLAAALRPRPQHAKIPARDEL